MSLVFPYRTGRSPRPVVSLGGRAGRPRPLIDATLVGPSGSKVVTALLDSGADDTVFSDQVAQSIGVDLSNAPRHTMTGVGSAPYVICYAPITLRLTDGKQVWYTPPGACGTRPRCSPAQSAAVSAIPGVAFSGSVDGHMRAYSAADGRRGF